MAGPGLSPLDAPTGDTLTRRRAQLQLFMEAVSSQVGCFGQVLAVHGDPVSRLMRGLMPVAPVPLTVPWAGDSGASDWKPSGARTSHTRTLAKGLQKYASRFSGFAVAAVEPIPAK